jgi:hypothetical protein
MKKFLKILVPVLSVVVIAGIYVNLKSRNKRVVTSIAPTKKVKDDKITLEKLAPSPIKKSIFNEDVFVEKKIVANKEGQSEEKKGVKVSIAPREEALTNLKDNDYDLGKSLKKVDLKQPPMNLKINF